MLYYTVKYTPWVSTSNPSGVKKSAKKTDFQTALTAAYAFADQNITDPQS